jgi:hypothetical protein
MTMVAHVPNDRPVTEVFWNASIAMGMDVLMIESAKLPAVPRMSGGNGMAIKVERPGRPATGTGQPEMPAAEFDRPGRITGVD